MISQMRIYSAIGSLLGIFLTGAALLCGLIAYQTIADFEVPLTFKDSGGIAYQWENGTAFFYRRTAHASADADLEMTRMITCASHEGTIAYDLPIIFRKYIAGESRDIVRVTHYPFPLDVGTKCTLITTVRWTPTFSMRPHTEYMPPIEFIVSEKMHDSP